MKTYDERANELKDYILEEARDEIKKLREDSTVKRLAQAFYKELEEDLGFINDTEIYFEKIRKMISIFEDLVEEYDEGMDEIEEDY